MNSAMSTMLASAAGINQDNRIAAGVGFAGGESAWRSATSAHQ
jgi:hypothetical protein